MLEGLLDPGEDGRSLPENEVGQVRQCEWLSAIALLLTNPQGQKITDLNIAS